MAKIFYDRSGKAHTIPEAGAKKQTDGKPLEGKSPENKKSNPAGRSSGAFTSRSDRFSNRNSKPDSGYDHAPRGPDRRPEPRADSGSFKGKSQSRSDNRPEKGKKYRNDSKRIGSGQTGPGGFQSRTSSSNQSGSGFKKSAPKTMDANWTTLKGVVDKNKKGNAFLVFDRADLEDVFIPRYYVDQLFHGDRIEVVINEEGEIEDLKVVEHRFKEIFGRMQLDERANAKSKVKTGHLVYERKKAKEEVWVTNVPAEVKEGDWVKAEMIYGENGQGVISAKIVEVIGPLLPAIYDIQMVAGEFNLTEHHTFEAVKQAESFKLEVPGKDEIGRTDLRHLPFITIDGERARDFDDAVYVERTENNGYRLWVAIADVSHYVKEGTALDDEAYKRGTSVYFPERAFHMLPRALSEELCSLKPNVPRLSIACSVEYSVDGAKGKIEVYDAIIESRRRSTYNEIEAEKEDPKHADLFGLYRILRKQRQDRGSIDFDFPEAEIVLDEKTGEPSDILVRHRFDAHRLIEEMMIAANEAVTEWMLEKKLPFIYRVHNEPSVEAIEKFRKLAKMMGVSLAAKGGIPKPKVLADFIKALVGHAAEPVLAQALLRSMRQAIYSSTFDIHYGLASEGYTHFTSPIRRYPDLEVHRQLRAALRNENKDTEETEVHLNEIAEHCSYRERIATEAERESIRFKQVRLMSKFVGKECDGKIISLMERGMFVQLDSPYCEGMITVDSMKDDFYEFNPERMVMAGRKKKRTFQVGKRVRVQVVRVDLDARQIELQLIKEL
jgi:ribonuclease R